MSTLLAHPERVVEASVFITADLIAFGYLAAHYAAAGGSFTSGPRKGQPYQARPGWGSQLKIDAITYWDPDALQSGAYVTLYASETVREWNDVPTKGLHVRKNFNQMNGGKEFEAYWIPIESFTRAMLCLDGVRL